jgi:uncharacterized protein (DUF2141 family)
MRKVFACSLIAIAHLAGLAPAFAEGPEDLEPEAMAQAQKACRHQPFSVLVNLSRIRSDKGVLVLDLHRDPATFLKKGGRIVRVWVPAVKGETQACVPVPEPGVYAVGVYQDKNSNLKFDKGFLGIPTEPYGVSNNPSIGFSAPSFEDSSFTVHGPLTPVPVAMH